MKPTRNRRSHRRMVRPAAALLAAVICLVPVLTSLAPITASASETREMVDIDRPGSITMTFTYFDEETGDTYPVTGGNSVGLYKVAGVSAEGGFKFVVDERFSSVGEIPATDEALDSANLELAAEMSQAAADYEYDKNPKKMDSEGKVTFEGLEVGLYLVKQAEKGTGDYAYTITPLLISIPYRNADGTLTYDVNTEPKPLKIDKEETEEPDDSEEPEKPHKKLPQTGQLWWPVMLMGAAGALFVLIGLAGRRRDR